MLLSFETPGTLGSDAVEPHPSGERCRYCSSLFIASFGQAGGEGLIFQGYYFYCDWFPNCMYSTGVSSVISYGDI
jgi:hypothetical protein